MKNNAKKILFSIVTSLLLSVGFAHAANSFNETFDDSAEGTIVNVEADDQGPAEFCAEVR